MSQLADALTRLAEASEAEVRLLRVQEDRERERARREAERVGHRSEPHRLSFATMAEAVPGLASQFARKVPPEFWSVDRGAAVVACPCGAQPCAELGIPTCCTCTRTYLYDGLYVRVAGSPRETEHSRS